MKKAKCRAPESRIHNDILYIAEKMIKKMASSSDGGWANDFLDAQLSERGHAQWALNPRGLQVANREVVAFFSLRFSNESKILRNQSFN